MLEVAALQAAYGRVPVLMGIDFQLKAGEFLGILGHNGMGKTTLMRTLMGFIPASAGGVTFPQHRHHRSQAARARSPRPRLRAAGPRDLSGAQRAG